MLSNSKNSEIRPGILERSLSDLPVHCKGEVKHIEAGIKATQRLSGMGITPGTIIEKISAAPFKGAIQIRIRGTRLAIGRGLAHKIILESLE